MKRLVLICMLLCVTASLAVAADNPESNVPVDITLKGDIIDNMCASAQKPEDLADFVKTHTKECALMPACVESGYSIFADGTLYKFDAGSNAKIAEFLNKEDSKLQVVVTAKKTGEELSLVTIENQM